MSTESTSLANWPNQTPAILERFDAESLGQDSMRRLQEYGFLPGAKLCVKHRGPIGGDPLAIEIRGSLIGIGKNQARHIYVVSGESK